MSLEEDGEPRCSLNESATKSLLNALHPNCHGELFVYTVRALNILLFYVNSIVRT